MQTENRSKFLAILNVTFADNNYLELCNTLPPIVRELTFPINSKESAFRTKLFNTLNNTEFKMDYRTICFHYPSPPTVPISSFIWEKSDLSESRPITCYSSFWDEKQLSMLGKEFRETLVEFLTKKFDEFVANINESSRILGLVGARDEKLVRKRIADLKTDLDATFYHDLGLV